jgi:hypothetical protein
MYQNYKNDLCGHSSEGNYDYALLARPGGVGDGSGLAFADVCPEPGEAVAMLGYPFEDPQLTLHQGHVSAVYKSGPATMLKLDMSVNPSNSGGPVMRLSDGKVVGVVARKHTGLSRMFDQLLGSLEQNIRDLSQPSDFRAAFGGIDPVQVLLMQQDQMRLAALEIKRSANVGIGYAVWIDPLRDEPALA